MQMTEAEYKELMAHFYFLIEEEYKQYVKKYF